LIYRIWSASRLSARVVLAHRSERWLLNAVGATGRNGDPAFASHRPLSAVARPVEV
jgi:hypothetical protein